MIEVRTFGNVLKTYREKANLTLADLSNKTEISTATISKIETDSLTRPNMRNVIGLAKELKIPLFQAITPYLDKIKRIETLEFLLEVALEQENTILIQKVALRLLECPKNNTFLSLDYLYQLAGNTEKVELRVAIYDIISHYCREHGIPVYLARSLFQKYMIRRENFKELDQTYIEGKELLHYMGYLHREERILAYYKLGVHAWCRRLYEECIQLCKQGIDQDPSQSEKKAAAILTIITSYMELGDYILATVYLDKYDEFDFPQVRKNVQYLRAKLYVKTEEFTKAIPALQECLECQDQNDRLPIANDLLAIYLKTDDKDGMQNIFLTEPTFLPAAPNTPSKYEQLALYYRAKGVFYLQQDLVELGVNSLIESITFYGKIGALEEVNQSLTTLLEYHTTNGKNLSLELLQNLVKVYNGFNIRS
ncbi:helix-turn-helix domain-containing protein [Brevibacillus sp. DP1.3A]|uniref:helix-turn-helix domain-containing protein n=1 Tax=Brevibacillus sp. DP1.3A TaxID=2738867 RepID=UPI00156B710B|nr:helix-turn-helix transcriptional regulator [Brevibacillus sp. DP1.3A]UED78119.1 helix-turn-helix domain-containing protein [Brevibacillus sp. DP1.3A]